MRKCVIVLLMLSCAAAAQRFPKFGRDPVNVQRAALHEKLTRLASTRQSLGMSELQPAMASAPLNDPFAELRPAPVKPAARHGKVRAGAHATKNKSVSKANHPPNANVSQDVNNQDVSLGDVARQYRAQKRHKDPTTN